MSVQPLEGALRERGCSCGRIRRGVEVRDRQNDRLTGPRAYEVAVRRIGHRQHIDAQRSGALPY